MFCMFDLNTDELITVCSLHETVMTLIRIVFCLIHALVAQLKSVASSELLLEETVKTI